MKCSSFQPFFIYTDHSYVGRFFKPPKRRKNVYFSVLLRSSIEHKKMMKGYGPISLKCVSIPVEMRLAKQKTIHFCGIPPI